MNQVNILEKLRGLQLFNTLSQLYGA